jgi:hypothetical protein
VVLSRVAGGGGPSDDEVAKRNFPQPEQPDDAGWADARRRFAESQNKVEAAIESGSDVDTFPYLTAHDAYHMGQINYLRAMQGLSPAE